MNVNTYTAMLVLGLALVAGPAAASEGPSTESCNNYGMYFNVGVDNDWNCDASVNVCENGTGSGAGAGAGSGGGSSSAAGASATAGSECNIERSDPDYAGPVDPCAKGPGDSMAFCVSGLAGDLVGGAVPLPGLLDPGVRVTGANRMQFAVECDNHGVFVTAGLLNDYGCGGDCTNQGVFVFVDPLGGVHCDSCTNHGVYVFVGSEGCGGRVLVCLGPTCLPEDQRSEAAATDVVAHCSLEVPFVCRAFFCHPVADGGAVGWHCSGHGDAPLEQCDAHDHPDCWALQYACTNHGHSVEAVVKMTLGQQHSLHCERFPGS